MTQKAYENIQNATLKRLEEGKIDAYKPSGQVITAIKGRNDVFNVQDNVSKQSYQVQNPRYQLDFAIWLPLNL